jgi:hypothetical protein
MACIAPPDRAPAKRRRKVLSETCRNFAIAAFGRPAASMSARSSHSCGVDRQLLRIGFVPLTPDAPAAKIGLNIAFFILPWLPPRLVTLPLVWSHNARAAGQGLFVLPAALPGVHFFGRGNITMFGTQDLTAAGASFAPYGIVTADAEDGAEFRLHFSNSSTASSRIRISLSPMRKLGNVPERTRLRIWRSLHCQRLATSEGRNT